MSREMKHIWNCNIFRLYFSCYKGGMIVTTQRRFNELFIDQIYN